LKFFEKTSTHVEVFSSSKSIMDNRRVFIKKACIAGACLCGFPSLLQATDATLNDTSDPDKEKGLMRDWISTLLLSIDEHVSRNECRNIMKKCAISHYEHLNMDELLLPYVGDIEKFNHFIEKEWGWKVRYQKEEGIIMANENKKTCVCPLVNSKKGVKSSILCYCSEGFAELMFSKVVGHPVQARVVSSIHRGDASCIYRISLS
jgi:hypothetical protein